MRLPLLIIAVLITAFPVTAQYEVSLVVDVPPGGYDGAEPTWLTVYDGKLYFRGLMGTIDDSTALWAYDAVSDEIAQIPGTASPEYFII